MRTMRVHNAQPSTMACIPTVEACAPLRRGSASRAIKAATIDRLPSRCDCDTLHSLFSRPHRRPRASNLGTSAPLETLE